MKRYSFIAALSLLLMGITSPSWAWVRYGYGWGHWHGPRFGVYVGGPYWPYAYPYSPYYDPYYAYPYYPYAYPAYGYYGAYPSVAITHESSTGTAQRDPQWTDSDIQRARDYANFQYQDGDISKSELNATLKHLDEVQKNAQAEAAAPGRTSAEATTESVAPVLPNMTPLPGTRVPANEQPRRNLKTVQDKLTQVRALLDKKKSEGNITPAQHKAESDYLNQLEKLANAQASANNGKISTRQETALLQELQHIDHVIQNNLMVH